MATGSRTPWVRRQFFDDNGDPLTLFYDVKWDEDNVRWRGIKDVGSSYWDPNTSTWIEE